MNVLTQDLARAFLSSSTNVQKYKFFSQGVQLEQLDQDYALIKNGIDSTEAVLQTKLGDIADLKASMLRANERLEQVKSHESLRNKIDLMVKQMAWAQVRDAEAEMEQRVKSVTLAEIKIQKAEIEREAASKAFDDANQAFEEATARVEQEKENLSPAEDAKKVVKEQFETNKKELQGLLVSFLLYLLSRLLTYPSLRQLSVR